LPSDMSASSNPSDKALDALQVRLGHTFQDLDILRLALRHASMGGDSNERLEFLGDRVLGLVVAERLFMNYPLTEEGGLAVRLNALVRREACAQAAQALDLGPHIELAKSEKKAGSRSKMAMLANACEAVIAALYLDGGMHAARNFIHQYWAEMFEGLAPELRDAKTILQEWAQSGVLKKKVQPQYKLTGRDGPDHAPAFTVEVRVPEHEPETGNGLTKREAEQDAARRLLLRLGEWKE
jgi:ribonuclease-3